MYVWIYVHTYAHTLLLAAFLPLWALVNSLPTKFSWRPKFCIAVMRCCWHCLLSLVFSSLVNKYISLVLFLWLTVCVCVTLLVWILLQRNHMQEIPWKLCCRHISAAIVAQDPYKCVHVYLYMCWFNHCNFMFISQLKHFPLSFSSKILPELI